METIMMMATNNGTMRELAQAAGVSIATVSLALRDDHRLAAATRKRIRALADAMGYRGATSWWPA